MACGLTIEAAVEPTGGTLLLQLAITLRESRLKPRSLVWSSPAESGFVKLSLVINAEPALYAKLTECIAEIPCVQKSEPVDYSMPNPLAPTPPDDALPSDRTSPFMDGRYAGKRSPSHLPEINASTINSALLSNLRPRRPSQTFKQRITFLQEKPAPGQRGRSR